MRGSPPTTRSRGAQRRAARRQQRQRRRFSHPLAIGAAVLAVAAIAVVGYLALGGRGGAAKPGVAVADEGRQHVAEGSPIEYKHVPPASGPHYPSPKPWGVYAQAVPEGYWVHNLEHGGIVLLFRCDGAACGQIADQIRGISASLPQSARWGEVKLLATPYGRMDAPFMLVAWDRQEALQTLDPTRVRAFYEAYLDRGPEDVP